MHKAHLFNHLGIESEDATAFMEDSREQVEEFGVERHQGTPVTGVAKNDEGFTVSSEEGEYEAPYVILARELTATSPRSLTVRSPTAWSTWT